MILRPTKLFSPEGEKGTAAQKCENGFSIPEGATEIAPCAFLDRSDVLTAAIPDGVAKIGDRAFAGCDNLKLPDISHLYKY